MTVVDTGSATTRSENRGFPRQHLILAALLLAAIAVVLSLRADHATANRKTIPLVLELEVQAPTELAGTSPTTPIAPAWKNYQVRAGDNLSLIFQRAGLDDGDVYHIVSRAPNGSSLTRIYPGQTLGFQISEQGNLLALRYVLSPLSSVIYRRSDGAYTLEKVVREPERHRELLPARGAPRGVARCGARRGRALLMCDHAVTVPAGPAVRVCTDCGTVVETLPEPSGCEGDACQS